MDPKELRIGNWVNGPLNYPVQIKTGSQIDEFARYYFPIELTSEILKNLGFKTSGSLNNDFIRDEVFLAQFLDYYIVELHSGLKEPSCIELKYVHQLQNFWSLLQEYLEVNESAFEVNEEKNNGVIVDAIWKEEAKDLEGNVMLEPLYLVRDYKKWDDDIVVRMKSANK